MPWDVIVFDIWNSFVRRAACSAANVIDVSPYDATVIQFDVECERTLDFTNYSRDPCYARVPKILGKYWISYLKVSFFCVLIMGGYLALNLVPYPGG